jgi:hypothetical protein
VWGASQSEDIITNKPQITKPNDSSTWTGWHSYGSEHENGTRSAAKVAKSGKGGSASAKPDDPGQRVFPDPVGNASVADWVGCIRRVPSSLSADAYQINRGRGSRILDIKANHRYASETAPR